METKKKKRKTPDAGPKEVKVEKEELTTEATPPPPENEENGETEIENPTKKAKKKWKKEKIQPAPPTEAEKPKPTKSRRYIVFVGNLAFTVTKEDLKHHFKGIEGKGKVVAVRLLTERGTNKPRGCAFVEFENAEALHAALKLHHTELNGRKINVEISAGGGGNSENRRRKIRQKNEKLHQERQKHFSQTVVEKKKQGTNQGEANQLP